MIHLRTSIYAVCIVFGCIFLLFRCIILFQPEKRYNGTIHNDGNGMLGLFAEHNLDSFASIETFKTLGYEGKIDYPPPFENNRNHCAPWLLGAERKVLFVELFTWKKYYGPSKYKTGEYYVSATWDYALRKSGFTVDRVSRREYYERMSKEDIMKYRLILVRDPRWHRFYDDHKVMCKVRPMYFFGGWSYGKNDHNYRFQVPFNEKQIVTAYPDESGRNTFMGYFPHNMLQILEEGATPSQNRDRIGLLYGKDPHYFEGYEGVIQALLEAGFELHTTCKDSEKIACPFPPEVIRHGTMPPDEFANLMKQLSFVLGFKKPPGSPTPLVGISNGVAFLNPLRTEKGDVAQHQALSKIGFPYSYIVDLGNSTDVVRAAEMAHRHRFSSYIPPSFRVQSLVDRVCSLLEDDSSCIVTQ